MRSVCMPKPTEEFKLFEIADADFVFSSKEDDAEGRRQTKTATTEAKGPRR